MSLKNAAIWERSAVNVVGYLVAYLGKSVSKLLDFAGAAIEQFEDKASFVFSPLMARLVGHALGADVSTEAIHERMERAGTTAIGNLTAQTVFDMLAPEAGELAPGDASAKRMVGALGHMTVNNWAEGLILEWLAEYTGWHIDLEALPHLAEQLIGNMGLNRLARTALRPLARIAVATPLEWKLNKQYRPKMLSASEVIGAWNRGDVDEDTMREVCAREGLGDDSIQALINAHIKTLSASDAYFLVGAGQWEHDDAIAELRLAGRDAARAEIEYNVEDLRALHKFELDMVAAAANAYADRRIDESTLVGKLNADTISTRTLARIHELASQRRAVNVQHLTRGDVESAVENGILSTSDYHDWLESRGYGHDDALTLELLLTAKLTKIEDARTARAAAAAQRRSDRAAKLQAEQARRNQLAGEHAHWTGTLGEAERLVVRDVMPPTQYVQVLIDHGLSPGDAEALANAAIADRDSRRAQIAARTAAAAKSKAPIVSLAVLERATVLGARTIEQLAGELATRGYAAADVAVLVDLVRDAIAARAAALARSAAAAARLLTKQISLGALQRSVVDGVRSIDDYRAFLEGQKFSATDVATLVGDMRVQLDNHRLALERHAAAEQKLAASHLSLAQEEKAVVDGFVTLFDYQAYLAEHGFDVDDQAILIALLEQKLGA